MASCSKKDESETTFLQFSKNILKSFILLTVVVMSLSLKNRLITEDTTLFYMALFIIAATILLTIVGIVDHYIYTNTVLGIGMALGLQLMDWRIK